MIIITTAIKTTAGRADAVIAQYRKIFPPEMRAGIYRANDDADSLLFLAEYDSIEAIPYTELTSLVADFSAVTGGMFTTNPETKLWTKVV